MVLLLIMKNTPNLQCLHLGVVVSENEKIVIFKRKCSLVMFDNHLSLIVTDTTHHIGRRYHIAMPSVEECQSMPKVDFTEFTSTFLCVSAKGIE